MYVLDFDNLHAYIAHPDGSGTIVCRAKNGETIKKSHRRITLQKVGTNGRFFLSRYPETTFVGKELVNDRYPKGIAACERLTPTIGELTFACP